MMRSFKLLCVFPLLLAGCGHLRPALQGNIAISAERISANLNQDATPGSVAPISDAQHSQADHFLESVAALQRHSNDIHQEICRKLLAEDISKDASAKLVPGHAVVLSGGGQHGAFGAGFLLGLQDKNNLPPEPVIVTGVSTGSLQATFVFLARQPVPQDRKDGKYAWLDPAVPTLASLPGADGERPLVAGRTNIEDLALAYSITRENEILQPSRIGAADILFTGALATLSPLRHRLMDIITPQTIQQVATESCRGRILLVGVTDVDDGNGYALDLTDLALGAFDGNATATRMETVRNTYVSALLASSSVPVGAMPVTLRYREFDQSAQPKEIESRQHLFIDGGARFGVFLPAINNAYDVTLLVNTTLTTDPWTPGNPSHPTTRWLLLDLALRTAQDILETQVYQLSVGKVERDATNLNMAYISNLGISGGGGPAETPDAHQYRRMTCADWKTEDEKSHPLQFYPAYMACLMDYGRSRGDLQLWNLSNTTAPSGSSGTK